MTSLPSNIQPLSFRTYARRKLGSRLIRTTAVTLYEVPANKVAKIDTLVICSVHSGSATLRVHHLRPDETVATSNALYYDLSVAAKTTTVLTTPIYMTAGDELIIIGGTADHICVTIYGEEQ